MNCVSFNACPFFFQRSFQSLNSFVFFDPNLTLQNGSDTEVHRIKIGVGTLPNVSPWCGKASPMLVQSGANVTSENPERNDALRLEDGEQSDVREPERNGILRLDEMMSRKQGAIDTYRSLSYF